MRIQPYKHLFFDMDKTIAPARQPILREMHELLSSLPHDIVIVSGQLLEKIDWQSAALRAYYLGNNGNHANDPDNIELWKNDDLPEHQKQEIHNHINELLAVIEETPNPDWNPIEDRGSQITFSPVGNTAPHEIKGVYDPDRTKRMALLDSIPFESEEVMLKLGGSTSFDYFPKNGHKGVNVARLIEHMGWNKDECVYYGDGLCPGGNDELVIGVIDTVPVEDHLDTYNKILKYIT
jgi:phosphomannomutase